MIHGIGIDIVETNRFKKWERYSPKAFSKIFSENEYNDGTRDGFSAQFFASRFAAKEAFYKAISQILFQIKCSDSKISLLAVAPYIEVVKNSWGIPELKVDWDLISTNLSVTLQNLSTLLSISHENKICMAVVVIQSKDQNLL